MFEVGLLVVVSKQPTAILQRIRMALGEEQRIAEELIPMESLVGFYKGHATIARTPVDFPDAEVVRGALPWGLVSAYRDTFEGAGVARRLQRKHSRQIDAFLRSCLRSGQWRQ